MNKVKLGDVCSFQEGYVNPSQTNKFFFGGDIKWLRASDLNDGFVYETERTLTKIGFESAGKSALLFKPNTLAISKSGSIGNLGILKDFMCGNRAVINIEPHLNKADLRYIFYFLKYNKNRLIKSAGGSIQKNLYVSILEPLILNHGEYTTQQKIASVLSALDDKIELNNKINAELEAMAKTLYDYWFVQFEFPNAEGKPYKSSDGKMVYNEVLKREIPEGWEVKKLFEIANITMGQSPSGESYNEEQNGMIFFQGSTDFGWRFPENRVYTTEPTRFSKEDDILLSVRAPIGTMNIAMDDCCIGRGLSALNSKDGFKSFLIYQMNYFKKKFDYLNSVGTTFGSLTKDELYNLELVYPSKEILFQFENIVSKFDEKIKINSKQNQELSSLRDWLLPMLMNGQVKVGEVEEEIKTKVYDFPQQEKLGKVAEGNMEYGSSSKRNDDELFELWLREEKLVARGDIDRATLRELFDAMDDEDKY